ncbi:MAG TPA: FAD-dependent oxidoreductase [Gemmatimonadaceae bacterium]|nr:FAD-dependent oxidoreductase [Gemmatimonadaceae bacterium]
MTTHNYEVLIVGGGPAGLCAGLYTGRAMLKSAILERGEPGGELLNTEIVEDYIGFEHILGRDLAEKFAAHAVKFGVELKQFMRVERISKNADGVFDVTVEGGDLYRAPAVIMTAGGTPVKLGIPGEFEYAGKGVSYCAICDGAFFRGHTIMTVGGGDAACEEADFLTRYAAKVYLVHRRDEFRASKLIQQRVFANPKIELITDTVVEEIFGDAAGLMTHARIKNIKTGAARDLQATGIFIFIGFTPNTGIIEGHVEHDASGYLITNSNMQTSIPGLFAAGDVRSQLTRQVTTAVGDATTAAIAAEKYLKAFKEAAVEG